jgi:hypothetical protein
MNKRIVFFLALIITGAIVGPAIARDPGTPAEPETTSAKPLFSFKTDDRESIFGDRFTLKAGYKVWVAKWQAQFAATTTAQNQVNTDHPMALNGPTVTGLLKLRDGSWFNSAFINFTWLHDGADFAEQRDDSSHVFANRRDYSLTAGLAIWEGFGIFGGYYNSRQEFTNQPNQPGLGVSRHPRLLDGPIIGIFGNVPASERFMLYGNLAMALLKFRGFCPAPNACAQTDSAQGFMNEVGVTIQGPRIWKIGTELQLGFRTQIIQKNFGSDATGAGTLNVSNQQPLLDVTYGPVFTINAAF